MKKAVLIFLITILASVTSFAQSNEKSEITNNKPKSSEIKTDEINKKTNIQNVKEIKTVAKTKEKPKPSVVGSSKSSHARPSHSNSSRGRRMRPANIGRPGNTGRR